MIDLRDKVAVGGISRHETFTPRYGWLKKGYDAAVKNGGIFNAPDAIEHLGVGKNMVRSIRSWCLAFNVLESDADNKGQLKPTDLGKKLLSDSGWDPFLEDIASLWLLHWHLFIPPFEASSWPLAFNYCTLQAFDHKQLTKILSSAAKHYNKLASLSEGSFDKDSSCIIRMYSDQKNVISSGTDCPFSQLGLVREAEEPNTFRFVTTEKQTLPSLIFAAACFSYAEHTQTTQKTLSLHKIIYEYNSPGVAFKVSETEGGRLLDEAVGKLNGVDFIESMGNRQVHFNNRPIDLFWQSLDRYFERKPQRGSL